MNTCGEYELLMADVLFDVPDPVTKERLDAHLAVCSECAAAFRTMQTTLGVMQRRERPAPPEGWTAFDARLNTRLACETRIARRQDRPTSALRASLRLRKVALASALVAAGVVLGWLLFAPPHVPRFAVQHDTEPATIQPASAEVRAQQVVRRSKVLLLGLVNYDPEGEAAGGFDLGHTQQVAGELAMEASVLRAELHADDQQRLQRLITELESVLIQIAALESKADLPAIELVKDDVDQQALLLKINISEMQAARSTTAASRATDSF